MQWLSVLAVIKLYMSEKCLEIHFRNSDILFMNFSAAISISHHMLDMALQEYMSPPCFMFCMFYCNSLLKMRCLKQFIFWQDPSHQEVDAGWEMTSVPPTSHKFLLTCTACSSAIRMACALWEIALFNLAPSLPRKLIICSFQEDQNYR